MCDRRDSHPLRRGSRPRASSASASTTAPGRGLEPRSLPSKSRALRHWTSPETYLVPRDGIEPPPPGFRPGARPPSCRGVRAPPAGIGPTTYRLTAGHSATELRRKHEETACQAVSDARLSKKVAPESGGDRIRARDSNPDHRFQRAGPFAPGRARNVKTQWIPRESNPHLTAQEAGALAVELRIRRPSGSGESNPIGTRVPAVLRTARLTVGITPRAAVATTGPLTRARLPLSPHDEGRHGVCWLASPRVRSHGHERPGKRRGRPAFAQAASSRRECATFPPTSGPPARRNRDDWLRREGSRAGHTSPHRPGALAFGSRRTVRPNVTT